jgi:hypothetical protein
MIRLHLTAEGQTEERFVNKILTPHLARYAVYTDVRCVLTGSRNHREYRGGFRRKNAYAAVRKDIMTWMAEDDNPECRFSTMFDLYALPEDFPGKSETSQETDPYRKVRILENRLYEDIADPRFIAYIQLHEFETLIFSNLKRLAIEYFDHEVAIRNLEKVLDGMNGNPELIDEHPATAPSKRIISEIPEYDKVNSGIIVAEDIGLEAMRSQCSHFDNWLTRLEQLI